MRFLPLLLLAAFVANCSTFEYHETPTGEISITGWNIAVLREAARPSPHLARSPEPASGEAVALVNVNRPDQLESEVLALVPIVSSYDQVRLVRRDTPNGQEFELEKDVGEGKAWGSITNLFAAAVGFMMGGG